ncbi:TAXI family TRAP transporter solute-binding subunit [Rubrivivax benzoatilyticus]|uniref:TAXI family TRAP transporter solute-binding subunit n=1 Tax=Rubrivivax benzoatilyticus TaxID=316997 RepID=UPI0009DA2DAC|nr:TAXI family TRAP transporter solute-binding subunit [Rubrivivax benzoatilyticus]
MPSDGKQPDLLSVIVVPDGLRPPSPRAPLARPLALRWRDALLQLSAWASLALAVAAVAAAWVAYRWLEPTPERRIVMASGPAQGAYEEFARRYVPLLRAHGVEVEIRPTGGSADNLRLLRDPASGVQVAFVQGGVDEIVDRDSDTLQSLGTIAHEPLWVFYREASARGFGPRGPNRVAQMAGWRVEVGPQGGGTAPLWRQILAANGVDPRAMRLEHRPTVFGVVELVEGRADALAMVSAADAPLVQYLLRAPGVRLMDFEQAQAYARRFPFLHALALPRGVVDLAHDQPPHDLHLVATSASLVARQDLHPALVQLLVQAARQAHGGAGWLHAPNEFPQAASAEWPLAPEAERFARSGPPWLQRYFPFWFASFVDRMWIVLLPLAAALIPLSRVLPPLLAMRFRSRVYRWYANLRELEQAIERPDAEFGRLHAELDRIDAQIARIGLPLAYTGELYDLRSHVQLVRKRLLVRASAQAAETAAG